MESNTVLSCNDFPTAVYTDPIKAAAACKELNDAEQAREDKFNSLMCNSLVGGGLLNPRRRFYHLHVVPVDPSAADVAK